MKPLRYLQGWGSALIAYPIAESREKRDVRGKLAGLRTHYRLPFAERELIAKKQLADTVAHAGAHVPYYRDLFAKLHFDPAKLQRDTGYLQDIPYLTKDILREEGERIFSRPLGEARFHICKTGGSTGVACRIYYDQLAADYSAAVTLFAREKTGKKKHMFELHFASKFPETHAFKDRMREHMKCFAMNRYNLFSDRLDAEGLEHIWQNLKKRRAYMVHAHPSTLYALACHIERTRGSARAFAVFESSGELLEPYMRDKIERVLQCRVIDRYGLAEFGVIAYQTDSESPDLTLFDSEGWVESAASGGEQEEIIFTGFRNRLMPLLRYRTGDLGKLSRRTDGIFLSHMLGRVHDIISIGGVLYPTHYVQDLLDRVGGIQEFQIDCRSATPKLLIVPEANADTAQMKTRIESWWKDDFTLQFVGLSDLIRVGERAKFRHVVL